MSDSECRVDHLGGDAPVRTAHVGGGATALAAPAGARSQGVRRRGFLTVLAIACVAVGFLQWVMSTTPPGWITMTLTGRGDMVFIPAGPSHFGYKGERPHGMNRAPYALKHLAAFYIDRYPVTNRKYKAFLDATGMKAPAHWSGGMYPPGSEEWPVFGVTYLHAEAYARWARKRMPTEEEWEKAARGNIDQDGPLAEGTNLYPWGYSRSSGNHDYKQPVGSNPRDVSAYGVHDLVEMSSQWTSSMFELTPYQGPAQARFNALHSTRGFDGCFSRNAVHRNMVCIKTGYPVLIRCAADVPWGP